MARKRAITIDDLWQLQRLGAPSLSPDGAQAVLAVQTHDMQANTAHSALWLLSTLGGRPRQLTQCGDKDGQPRFSPRGHDIGFVARREQQGKKDAAPQFYLIPADGGEARRVGEVATGIEAFKWHPDGQSIVFVSWVWPQLKGQKAQAKAMQAQKDRKATGVATSEGLYRYWDHMLPEGRVPHLLRMNLQSGRVTDLFEGTAYSLDWCDPQASSFDISPDGKRVVFAYDPAPERRIDGRFALAEIDLKRGRIEPVAMDPGWDLTSPRYSPDGKRIACVASHQALSHTSSPQLAVFEPGEPFEVVSAEWDHAVEAPLHWEEDGSALLFAAEQQGCKHLWRFDIADRRAERLVTGGTVQGFDKAAGTLVSVADSAAHPARCHVHLPDAPPRRLETFNDAVLAPLDLGHHETLTVTGALGEPVQVWLHFPPGFDAKKRYPLVQLIHGGPHTVMGDAWHYRWNAPLLAAGGATKSGKGGKGQADKPAGQVVAIVNYHGSTSYGNAFVASINSRWGQLELQDVEAATTELLKRPWVDPARVHAIGGSYGGYMVAWMNGHVPPGRYASYVCHAGCFDWVAMFADDAWAWHAKELGAWYFDDIAKVQAQSPHAFAKAMKTPTLVIHGALDYRVPDAQGLAYYNTLKALGVDARLLWFPDENHWVLKPQNSRLWYQEVQAWLRGHSATPAPAAASRTGYARARRKAAAPDAAAAPARKG